MSSPLLKAKWKVMCDQIINFSPQVQLLPPVQPRDGRIRKVSPYPGVSSFLVGSRGPPLASGQSTGKVWVHFSALFPAPSGCLGLAVILVEKKLAEGSGARLSKDTFPCLPVPWSLPPGGTWHLLATRS